MRPWISLVLITACSGGGRSQIKIGPVPDRATHGNLAGPLCHGSECTCRTGNEDAGEPDRPNTKRFEIRLGSPYELWVTLPNDTLLYKNAERAEACFYVDLAPGVFPVELRASQPSGVSATIEVHELGVAAKSWYDTFRFSCGGGGVCSYDQIDSQMAEYRAIGRGLHDPCGSTKIKGIAWDHGKDPDQQHPSNLVLHFTLDVYKFAPDKPHGAACGEGTGRHKGKPDEQPL